MIPYMALMKLVGSSAELLASLLDKKIVAIVSHFRIKRLVCA